MYEWQEIDGTMNKLYEVLCSREDGRGLSSKNIKGVTLWIITG